MGMAVGMAKRGAFADINIVPLIDVLLVLLVIFMILPHQQTGLQVEIPRPGPPGPAPRLDVIVVEVLADGSLQINRQPVKWEGLRDRLEDIQQGG